MKNNLDDFFSSAKKLDNLNDPISNSELEIIIHKAELKINSKYKYFIGGFMLLISLAFLYLGLNFFNSEQIISNSDHNSKLDSTINTTDIITLIVDSTAKNNSNLLEKDIISKDVNKTIVNPYRTEPRQELIRETTIKIDGKNVDLLEPSSINKDIEGNAISGLLKLELSNEELAQIGVKNNDTTIEYGIEYYHVLHPIPFRNNDAYKLDPENKLTAEKDYPIDGDTFLVKSTHKIILNHKANIAAMLEPSNPLYSYRIIPYFDTLNGKVRRNLKKVLLGTSNIFEVYDTVDGNVRKSYKRINSSKSNVYDIGPDYLEYLDYWKSQYLQGYEVSVQRYGGWDIQNYSRTLPVIAAFKYYGTKHKYIYQPYSNPIKMNYLNNMDYSKLIPLELNFRAGLLIEKLILWYYPTPEFVKLLPERYRKVLQNELNIITKLNNQELDLNSACEKVNDETFFDICRFQKGAIKINNIYPNPTNESNIKLSYELTEPRTIEINIYNSQGSFVGRIHQEQRKEAGTHSLRINLGNISTGVYLIGIITDKNEIVSKRIIIN